MNQRHRPFLWAVVYVTAAVVVIGLLALLIRTWSLTDQIRESQKTNTGTLEATQQTLDAVQDCTQPTGKCFQRGQKRTASAVGDINRVVILASACSVGLDVHLSVEQRQADIQACVIERLAAKP